VPPIELWKNKLKEFTFLKNLSVDDMKIAVAKIEKCARERKGTALEADC
jgi:hypothetical protein